jgi:hypothetical protein
MAESFFMLLAAGVMLAAAISDPKQVTLHWLRLAGLIALTMAGLGIFFFTRRSDFAFGQVRYFVLATIAILGQLAFVQSGWKRAQRAFALAATICGIVGACVLLDHNPIAVSLATLGIAAMSGLCLMDMLLGHAYLTASKMTIAPFLRLNGAFAVATVFRTITATVGVWLVQRMHPVEMLWQVQGLYILTRYLIGLIVPAVFIYMAHDCIKRRATQSATGILYVCGVLVFIGELTALYLVKETGLPF